MKGRFGPTMVFIAHDLAVGEEHQRSRRGHVPRQGVCELAPSDGIYEQPPSTRTPWSPRRDPATLIPMPGLIDVEIPGDAPSPTDPPSGCRFRPGVRTPMILCAAEVPELRSCGQITSSPCHKPLLADDRR